MSAHADEWRDPLEPAMPGRYDYGRAAGRIEPGWTCRVCCSALLAEVVTSRGPVAVCLECDGLS